MWALSPALISNGDALGSSSSCRMSYVAGCPSSGTTISINSGELDLKTRLNVSFALSAGATAAEMAAGAPLAAPATGKEAAEFGPINQIRPQTIVSAKER